MDKQDQAINRLLKKLSALRATLRGEERDLLAGILTGGADEVGAHAMNISTAKSTVKSTAADEVKANAMKVSTAKSTVKSTGVRPG